MTFSIATLVWLGLVILFAVLEAATVGLVSIWFAAGAVAALLVSGLTQSVLVQSAVFILVSGAALAVTRPLVKKHRVNRREPTNADRNVGRKAAVIAAISPEVPGRVRLDGVDWIARAGVPLQEGELCIVTAVDGATLYVAAPAHAPV